MSDDEVRALQRALAASNAIDDEVRLLHACVRVGMLTPAALELAAWLGRPAARLALEGRVPSFHEPPLPRWVAGLSDRERRNLVRAAIEPFQTARRGPRVRAVRAVRAWCDGGPPAPRELTTDGAVVDFSPWLADLVALAAGAMAGSASWAA